MRCRAFLFLFALPLTPSFPAISAAAPPNVDWLHPSGAGRESKTIISANDGGSWPVQIWIDRPEGIDAQVLKENGKFTVTTTAEVVPGVRWIRLFNGEGASSLRPFIIGSLAEIEEKEPNNNTPQEIGAPVVINGKLAANNDIDVYKVHLLKGRTLVASMTANQILGSPMDGVIQLCDAQGFVLAQNDDALGLDPQLVHEVTRDGDYLIRTFAFPATPNSSIHYAGGADYLYRLTVTTGPFVDHTMPLAVAAGKPAEIALFGWNLPVELMRTSITPEADRRWITLAHPLLANTLDLPTTSASLLTADADEKSPQPQDVAVPAVITGRLASDRAAHRFRFTAKKGQSVRIQAESESLGYPLDPVLRIADAAGKQLVENDDAAKGGRDAQIDFKPPADGQYTVTLTDLHQRGGFRFVYRLTMEPIVPTFAVTLATDRFNTTPAKPLEIPITIDRRDGFGEEITLRIEGLPDGFKAEPVVSAKQGATAKSVKLIITAAAGPWSGPFRVVAESSGKRETATFPTIGAARHDQAWLTVGKPAAK